MREWTEHAIWWHVYPLGFLGAEPGALPEGAEPVPRLRRLTSWLPHLLGLGCNGLALGPVFAAETHGYDTVDHHRVDARLGTEEDLLALVGACREQGVRVLLDGVFNHVGRGFPAFQDVLAHGRGSRYAGWFRIDWDGEGPDGFTYDTFEGHRHLVTLDHGNPEVADHVADVMTRWLAAGVDGWRLDAAYAVPLGFWRTVSDRVHAAHPDAWLVGEVLHGDHRRWVQEGGLDATTQYELWKGIWSSLNDRNLFELQHALDRHADYAEVFRPLTFLGNHDVTRLASRLDDPRHVGHALAVLCTVAGTPSIYAGDEEGYEGVKEDREGGDDAVRQPFPATPEQLDPAGEEPRALNRELIALRRRNPWLADARTRVLELENTSIAYEAAADGHHLVVLLHVGDEPRRFRPTGRAVEVVAGVATDDPWRVGPHGWAVLAPR